MFVEWFRFVVVALIRIQQRKIVQVGRDFGMVGAERPLVESPARTLVKRFGLRA